MLAAARRAAGVGSSPPPPGTPPDLVRLWWAALTSDEQQRAVRGWPIAVGALGGLPAAVRSAANEHRLERDIAMLLARSSLSDDDERWLESCLLVRAQLARVRAVRDPDGLGPMTAQLLAFDPKAYGSEGRVALAVGDVDTADNVAFLVPGMGSDVRGALADLTGNAMRHHVGCAARFAGHDDGDGGLAGVRRARAARGDARARGRTRAPTCSSPTCSPYRPAAPSSRTSP